MNSRINTFIFMDCETTGLEPWAKITELCFVAIQTSHLLTTPRNELPRVLHKLNLCFNPMKLVQPGASDITGLSNDLLEHTLPFSDTTVQMLECFVSHLPQPACLVAHNGDKFDYNILRNHISKHELEHGYGAITKLLSVDSLVVARSQYNSEMEQLKIMEEEKDIWGSLGVELTDDDDEDFLERAKLAQAKNETTPNKKGDLNGKQSNGRQTSTKKKLNFGNKKPSFKLCDWYERLTGQKALRSHEAESDVVMMAKCAAAMGDDFVTRANNIAVQFFKA